MAYLELRNVSRTFGNVTAVKDFSLDVEKGSLVSLLGPSGCGKTTTLRMIAGFEQPDSGSIYLDNEDITPVPPNRRDIGMVFQAYALFPNMNVRQNVAFGLQMRQMDKVSIEKRVNNMLELVRLQNVAKRYPHQLSGGQQQRIALARALAVQPRMLLLDEPLSALDAKVRIALRGEIRRIQTELAITTIYVTHDQEEALSISDKVVVMDQGKIQQTGTPIEIYRAPQNRFVATFIGTANQFVGKTIASNRVISNGLTLVTNSMVNIKDQQDVVVLVRPEHIQVKTEEFHNKDWNSVAGVVETITFHGAVTRLGVNVNDRHIVADISATNADVISLGKQVYLAFPPDACQVLPINQ